jgi:hypothetical protein
MIGYIVLAFLIYFLYRFIVGFVLPVVRTANQMKRKVREMNNPYGQGPFSQAGGAQQRTSQQAKVNVTGEKKGPFSRFSKQKAAGQAVKPSKSDYIEFEELN